MTPEGRGRACKSCFNPALFDTAQWDVETMVVYEKPSSCGDRGSQIGGMSVTIGGWQGLSEPWPPPQENGLGVPMSHFGSFKVGKRPTMVG